MEDCFLSGRWRLSYDRLRRSCRRQVRIDLEARLEVLSKTSRDRGQTGSLPRDGSETASRSRRMWLPKTSAVALTAATAVACFLFAAAPQARAQNWHWCGCLRSVKGRHTSNDWAGEAAALGVVGGAPALGFCGSITGYEQGVIRVAFPTPSAESATSGGGQDGSTAMPSGSLPPAATTPADSSRPAGK